MKTTTTYIALPLVLAMGLLLAACGNEATESTETPLLPAIETGDTPATPTEPREVELLPATSNSAATTPAAPAAGQTVELKPAIETNEPAANVPAGPAADTATPTAGATYTAQERFFTPGGPHTMGVSVTVDSSGVITAIATTNDAEDDASVMYYDQFTAALSGQIVGKTIDQAANTGRIGGASLCTGALKDALATIQKEQA